MEVGVGVTRKGKRRETGLAHGYCELLAQFAYQGIFRPLAILDFAAGKFPESGHRLAWGPLCNQHAAIRIDERASRNQDDLESQGASSGFMSDSRR
jgi:hypothetical protein